MRTGCSQLADAAPALDRFLPLRDTDRYPGHIQAETGHDLRTMLRIDCAIFEQVARYPKDEPGRHGPRCDASDLAYGPN